MVSERCGGLPDGHECRVELPGSRSRGIIRFGRGTARLDGRANLSKMVVSEQRGVVAFSAYEAPWRRSGAEGANCAIGKDKGNLGRQGQGRADESRRRSMAQYGGRV
jgi:hypothetical protein